METIQILVKLALMFMLLLLFLLLLCFSLLDKLEAVEDVYPCLLHRLFVLLSSLWLVWDCLLNEMNELLLARAFYLV